MAIGLAVIAAYLLGSISFAIVVSKLMRLPDPRTYGSKNPGTTNVLRSGSKAAAVFTLLGDALKGWLAVWLAQSQHFRLVETLADRIAMLLTKEFGAPWVKVSVAKIGILPNAKFVGVTIERRRPG